MALLLLASKGSTLRKSLIPEHTGFASLHAGSALMVKCGANRLSSSKFATDAGITTEQPA